MTQDELTLMSQHHGAAITPDGYVVLTTQALLKFVELVTAEAKADEREACAAVCDNTLAQHYMKKLIPAKDEAMLLAACADCAAAIRARSNT